MTTSSLRDQLGGFMTTSVINKTRLVIRENPVWLHENAWYSILKELRGVGWLHGQHGLEGSFKYIEARIDNRTGNALLKAEKRDGTIGYLDIEVIEKE